MSIYQDHKSFYSTSWHSSPWKPYFNKIQSRTIAADSGDSVIITGYCAEEDLLGVTFGLYVTGNSGIDHLTRVSYPDPDGGSDFAELDDFKVSQQDDSRLASKWWYAPGVAMRFPDDIHNTDDYTSALTVYTYTIAASDIGEKVYDGGIHCWMKLPHAPQDGGSTPAVETDIYSKNIPMEFMNNNDFLMVYNSYSCHPVRGTGNCGLTIQYEYSDMLNAVTGQFVDDSDPLFDDVDVSAITTDVLDSRILTVVATGGGAFGRENVKSMRFRWFTEDSTGGEATFHGGQFIRVSLYPIKR